MTRPARIACLALLVSCGDPSAPGDDDSGSAADATPTSTSAPPPTTGEPDDETTADAGSGSADGTMGTTGTTGEPVDPTAGPPACGPELVAERGFFTATAPAQDIALTACGEDLWYFAAPSQATVEVTLTRRTGAELSAVIVYPDEPADVVWSAGLTAPLVSDAEPASVLLAIPRSGEFAVHVDALADDAGATYDLAIRCVLGCERETTRFPIVLVHGWTGWDAVGPLTYFYNVKDDLAGLGYPVHAVQLDPYNHTNVRAGQLADQLDDILPTWRARKVDLIGHSQGGIDSRGVIGTYGYGDRVSAVITIGSPHRGTFIADAALGLAPGPVEDIAGLLLNFLGAVTAQQQSDAIASFESLSEAHMLGEFNPANPDDPRVQYISYTGRTCDALDFLDADLDCQDLVDPLIGWSYDILKLARGANDGLVTVDSAVWADYRGEMAADHIDEVGQVLGITDPKFDHLEFYRARARELADEQH
jgi:pimeloyl-ACP methyl ester carboxylesterase